jgi:hypothetical protein
MVKFVLKRVMLSKEIRCLVQTKRSEGRSIREIGYELNISTITVHNILKHTFGDWSYKATGHAGRPRLLNTRDERVIYNTAMKNPFATIQELITSVFGKEQANGISKQTILCILGRFGIHNFRVRHKPLLTQCARQLRIKYTNKNMDWTRVIFSNEKRFRLQSDGPKRVWRKRGSFKECKKRSRNHKVWKWINYDMACRQV